MLNALKVVAGLFPVALILVVGGLLAVGFKLAPALQDAAPWLAKPIGEMPVAVAILVAVVLWVVLR